MRVRLEEGMLYVVRSVFRANTADCRGPAQGPSGCPTPGIIAWGGADGQRMLGSDVSRTGQTRRVDRTRGSSFQMLISTRALSGATASFRWVERLRDYANH